MLNGLIDGVLAQAIADAVKTEDITEIRLRLGRSPFVSTVNGGFRLKSYVIAQKDIERIMNNATDMSVYSVNDEMIRGYIPCKNLRIGVAGEGVLDNGRLLTVKNVAYLVIRIPHQIKNAAAEFVGDTVCPRVKNTLVISPPGAGKTTLLRELAREASASNSVVIIDERYELACVANGVPSLDIGNCEVMSGIPKTVAYENCVRTMNPDVIVTDEIFRAAEVDAVCDIVRSGVKVFASVHANSIAAIKESRVFAPLTDVFEYAVVLSKTPKIGSVVERAELK